MSASVPPPGWTESGRPEPVLSPAAPALPASPSTARPRRKLMAGGLLVAALTGIAFLLLGSAGLQFDPLAQAAALSARTPGYRMHMTLQISSPAVTFSAEADGVVDLHDRAASTSMTMNLPADPQVIQALGGDTLTINMVVEGTVVYVRFPPALASKLPYDKPWLKLDMGKVLDSAGLSGITSMMDNPMSNDPSSQLAYLRAVSGDVVDEGPEAVGGTVTTHYHADVDLSRLADIVPPAQAPVMSQTVSKLEAELGSDQMPIDVWVDHNHLVRQIEIVFSPAGSAVQESMTEDLTDYGPQSRPVPPPANQVQDITGALGG